MKLKTHHYDVYLKSRHGTIKRRVGIKTKSVALAGKTAQDEVQRTIRESVTVADVVPLRVVQSKKAPVTKGRGRKQVTTSVVQFKQSRRPKARESVRITNKGKLRGVEGFVKPDVVTPHESFVGKASDKPTHPTCESKACVSRGWCTHDKRLPGVERREWVIKTNHFREVQHNRKDIKGTRRERLWMTTIATSEEQARKQCRKELHDLGIKNVRFLACNPRHTI